MSITPDINTVLAYLTSLYNKGLGYSSINTARSAISSFLNLCGKVNIHNDGRVRRFMKRVLIDQPALIQNHLGCGHHAVLFKGYPRYDFISIVL